MRKLATSKVITKTEVYTYNTHAEYDKHFAEMQSNGWVGSFTGEAHENWITSYRKSSLEYEDSKSYLK